MISQLCWPRTLTLNVQWRLLQTQEPGMKNYFTFYIQDHYFNFATVESRWLSLIKTNIQQIWTQFNQPSSLHHQETFDQEFIQSQLNWISKNTSIWLIASDWNSQKGIFACDNKFQKKDFVKFNEIIFKDLMFPGMLCLTLAPTTVI